MWGSEGSDRDLSGEEREMKGIGDYYWVSKRLGREGGVYQPTRGWGR